MCDDRRRRCNQRRARRRTRYEETPLDFNPHITSEEVERIVSRIKADERERARNYRRTQVYVLTMAALTIVLLVLTYLIFLS
jgi:hypothetical protein